MANENQYVNAEHFWAVNASSTVKTRMKPIQVLQDEVAGEVAMYRTSTATT